MANIFLTPQKIISGSNALIESGPFIASLGKKALIVTDFTMIKLGNVEILENVLKKNNIEYIIYSEINSEPNDIMINRGLQKYKENNCDFLIALGGGSPIDSMKAIGIMSTTNEHISSFMGKQIDVDMPKLVAIPTTAGTGSEATKFTIINNTATQVKMLLQGSCLIPTLACIDPQFTMTAPKNVTGSTGIDALCHAIEAYTSKKAQPLSDTFALSAIKRIYDNLLICYQEPKNEKARIQMSLAAIEAGIAFNNSSVTIIHGMSRPIGAIFHVPHGLSNAMLLEECIKFIIDGAYPRFANIARYLNLTHCSDDIKASTYFVDSLVNLLKKLNIPSMSEFGIDKEIYFKSIKKMASDAFTSGSPSNTMKSITMNDIVNLYKKIYK